MPHSSFPSVRCRGTRAPGVLQHARILRCRPSRGKFAIRRRRPSGHHRACSFSSPDLLPPGARTGLALLDDVGAAVVQVVGAGGLTADVGRSRVANSGKTRIACGCRQFELCPLFCALFSVRLFSLRRSCSRTVDEHCPGCVGVLQCAVASLRLESEVDVRSPKCERVHRN